MSPTASETLATSCFAFAILHSFCVKRIERAAHALRPGSPVRLVVHALAEVELVFGLWALFFLAGLALLEGPDGVARLLGAVSFHEAVLVAVLMAIASRRPVLAVASRAMAGLAGLLPLSPGIAAYVATLVAGPLLGSLITEPAAMTVTALLLDRRLFRGEGGAKLAYVTLGTLFVNVSIGGVLTPFAAPPVVLVARAWGWGFGHMLGHFGWKAIVAVIVNTAVAAYAFRARLRELGATDAARVPVAPRLAQSLFVGIFLAGLVVLGELQKWWLAPLIARLDPGSLFFGAVALTAVVDNAALTFLGTRVALSEAMRYALVAGAVCGGGLTVIANAPNPIGFGLLRESFGEDGISPLGLFAGALVPTAIAIACFWGFP